MMVKISQTKNKRDREGDQPNSKSNQTELINTLYPNKRMKADTNQESGPTTIAVNRKARRLRLQDLCEDVIRLIYEFIGSVRDLFTLASQTKVLMNSVTNEIVIRTAVFEKGLPNTVISRVIKAIQDGSIYVPSTMRLLRLVNGVRCERLDQCWGFNLQENASLKVNSVWMAGLFTCYDCAVGLSAAFNKDGSWARNDDKVLRGCFGWTNKVLTEPFHEKATGVRVGPLVPMLKIKQISRSFPERTERLSALSNLVDEEKKLDKNADQSIKMIECYNTALVDAEAYSQRREAEIAAQVHARNQRKLGEWRSMYNMLHNCLGDEPWRDAIMECEWYENESSLRFGVDFHCSIVSRAVEFYVRRPSQINEKNISRVAKRIKKSMSPFISTNFFSADYLQSILHPFAFVLYEFIRSIPLSSILRRLPSSNFKFSKLMSMLHTGQLEDGLMLILHGGKILEQAFAFSVVPDVDRMEIDTNIDIPNPLQDLLLVKNFTDMAESIWRSETGSNRLYNGQYRYDEMTFQEAKYWWDRCVQSYTITSRNIIEFFTSEPTVEFIEETINNEEVTGKKIKNFTNVFTSPEYRHLLESRNYASLLRMQRNLLRT